jgi:hypothetical protein
LTTFLQNLLQSGVDYVWPKPPPLPEHIKAKIEELLRKKMSETEDQ